MKTSITQSATTPSTALEAVEEKNDSDGYPYGFKIVERRWGLMGIRRKYKVVGTLGEPAVPGITCSGAAALHWGQAKHLDLYPDYEDVLHALKNGDVDAALVAGAYPKLASFIQDTELVLVEVFSDPIPDLVYAGSPEADADNPEVVYYHPATKSLLASITARVGKYVEVSSNAAACVAAMNYGPRAMTVTNALCVRHYGFNISQVLRSHGQMLWHLFARRQMYPAVIHPAMYALPQAA